MRIMEQQLFRCFRINSTRLIDPVKQFDFTPDEMGLPYEDSDIISNFESYYSTYLFCSDYWLLGLYYSPPLS